MKLSLFTIVIFLFSTSFYSQQYGWYQQTSGTAVKLNSICNGYYPDTHQWIAGNNGTVLATTNSGVNWIAQNSGTTNNLNSIQFKNLLTGFAVGDNGTIIRTFNGGNNWEILNSGTSNDLLGISSEFFYGQDSVSSLYAVGRNGIILKTSNFGNNWFSQNSGTTNDLRSIHFYGYHALWISGAEGTLLKTTDGGNTWKLMSSNTQIQLNSVNFLYNNGNLLGGLTAGNNGTLLRSYNLGENWTQLQSGTNVNLNSIADQYFLSFLVSGNNGTILNTTDLGTTWFQDNITTNNNLNSIIYLNANTAWAVGDNGTIIHTNTEFWGTDSKKMDANSISTWFSNNGFFNNNPFNGSAGFEWPKGQNKFSRFTSGLWLAATINGQVNVSFAHYSTTMYLQGYTDNNGNPKGMNDPAYRMYKLTYGVNDSGRIFWPNALLGNADEGAPVYFDSVTNNWKPLDLGEQTIFYCYTDSYPWAHFDYTQPLKADIKQTNFAFGGTEPLSNTIYSQYIIINRNNVPWNNLYISFWTDDDIGNPLDDRAGCDTIQQIGFTYNGTNLDTSYGAAPPAVSTNLIKGPIVFTGNNNDTASFCRGKTKITKIGFKQLGMSVSNAYVNGVDPLLAEEYYNYMRGLNLSGQPIINPFTGQPTKFVYSGDPENHTGWNQGSLADMRFLISVGPINMNPGDTQIIVTAQLIARGTNNLNSVTKLKQYASLVRGYYNNCFENVPIEVENNSNQIPKKFALLQNYPNPFNPKTVIGYELAFNCFVKLVVYDMLGKEIKTLVNEAQSAGVYKVDFDGTNFPSGVYFYQISAGSYSETKKLVLVK